jgi:hypothetical protein
LTHVRRSSALLTLALASVLLFAPLTTASVGSFVQYRITATLPGGVRSAVVNETISSSDKPGMSVLSLAVSGSVQNLTYSRLVNATEAFFPYLTPIGSQALDYSNGTSVMLRANVTSTGTSELAFAGSNYTMDEYALTISVVYGNRTANLVGTVETFPSALVYSASLEANGMASVKVYLLSTDLQLDPQSSSVSSAAFVGAGLGVGAVALVAALLVRRRENAAAKQPRQPHWVD